MAKGKIAVKNKFKNAILHLRKLSKQKQRNVAQNASKEFINDLIKFLKNIRSKGHLLNYSQRNGMKRHKHKLQRLVDGKVSIKSKRKILMMKGGILPFLIPIICAAIGAAGTVGGAAASAAIAKA